jgi:hypothetical protein
MSAPEFRKERIVELLDELERRLADRGVALNIQIVGGAALLLHGLLDRSTEDIDARYTSAPVVEEVTREMAAEYGLPAGWLNSKAAAFLPDDAAWIAEEKGASAAVWLADLPTLAAMKLAAERQKDIEDLGRIANALGITDPADLVRIALRSTVRIPFRWPPRGKTTR